MPTTPIVHSWDVDRPAMNAEEAECLAIDAWLVSRAARLGGRMTLNELTVIDGPTPSDKGTSVAPGIATK